MLCHQKIGHAVGVTEAVGSCVPEQTAGSLRKRSNCATTHQNRAIAGHTTQHLGHGEGQVSLAFFRRRLLGRDGTRNFSLPYGRL
jgi:hypothetical protein